MKKIRLWLSAALLGAAVLGCKSTSSPEGTTTPRAVAPGQPDHPIYPKAPAALAPTPPLIAPGFAPELSNQ